MLTTISVLSSKLADQPIFAAHAKELTADATSLVHWMKDEAEGDAAIVMKEAFSDSLRLVYAVMAGFAFVATIASFWTKHYDIDQALETDQGLSELQNAKVREREGARG